jgi:hypothetical protein
MKLYYLQERGVYRQAGPAKLCCQRMDKPGSLSMESFPSSFAQGAVKPSKSTSTGAVAPAGSSSRADAEDGKKASEKQVDKYGVRQSQTPRSWFELPFDALSGAFRLRECRNGMKREDWHAQPTSKR